MANDLRRSVAALASLAAADLDALWRQVKTAAQAREALGEVLPVLIDTYGAAAATLAADWYDELREQAEVPGRFTAIPVPVTDTGAEALAGWGASLMLRGEADGLTAQSMVAGGVQRRIANASRHTVAQSSVADPGADGWQRVGNGSCAFCRMLIGRGVVYSEASADFASHDHCHCHAAPAFSGQPRPVQPYKPSERNITEADRARVRAWIRNNP